MRPLLVPLVAPVLSALFVAQAALVPPAVAKPSPQVVRDAAMSVVRVMADGCPGDVQSRQGSGFVWPTVGSVVTALHVVADCDRVVLEFVDHGVQRAASVAKVLRRADLALLTVADPPDVRALSSARSSSEQEELAAIGMPLNVRTWQETYGTRSVNVRVLNDLLNDDVRRQIQQLGTPDIDLEIFRLTATVKPGSSGGPVINTQGAVVGVVDGGLDGGSASLNWAVPTRYLAELEASQESGGNVGLGAAVDVAFAFSSPEDDSAGAAVNEQLTCGGRRFFKLATRTLDEIVGSVQNPGTVDDPQGFLNLVQLASNFLPPDRLAALRFQLYVDEESGATAAVPETMSIYDEDGFCVAESDYGEVGLLFQGTSFNPGLTNLQVVSNQFDIAAGRMLNLGPCQPDLMWMEPVPHFRFDGLIARRTGVSCFDAFSGEQVYAVVGYLGRENSFMGVAAINHDLLATNMGGAPDLIREWFAAALAVLISTYQI